MMSVEKKKKCIFKKKKKLENLNSNVTHVRLYGCRSLRPSGSCKSDMRLLLFRRTTNRFHTVPMSMFRWCTSRIGRSSRDEGTFVHRVFPGIATIVPRCILGTGSLENVIDLKTNIHFRYTQILLSVFGLLQTNSLIALSVNCANDFIFFVTQINLITFYENKLKKLFLYCYKKKNI